MGGVKEGKGEKGMAGKLRGKVTVCLPPTSAPRSASEVCEAVRSVTLNLANFSEIAK